MILPNEWLTCKRRTSLKRAGRDRSGQAPAIPRGRQAAKFKPGNHATVAELVDAQDLGSSLNPLASTRIDRHSLEGHELERVATPAQQRCPLMLDGDEG